MSLRRAATVTVVCLFTTHAFGAGFKVTAPITWKKVSGNEDATVYKNGRTSQLVITRTMAVEARGTSDFALVKRHLHELSIARAGLLSKFGVGNYSILTIENRPAKAYKADKVFVLHAKARGITGNDLQIIERQLFSGGKMYQTMYIEEAATLMDLKRIDSLMDNFRPVLGTARDPAAETKSGGSEIATCRGCESAHSEKLLYNFKKDTRFSKERCDAIAKQYGIPAGDLRAEADAPGVTTKMFADAGAGCRDIVWPPIRDRLHAAAETVSTEKGLKSIPGFLGRTFVSSVKGMLNSGAELGEQVVTAGRATFGSGERVGEQVNAGLGHIRDKGVYEIAKDFQLSSATLLVGEGIKNANAMFDNTMAGMYRYAVENLNYFGCFNLKKQGEIMCKALPPIAKAVGGLAIFKVARGISLSAKEAAGVDTAIKDASGMAAPARLAQNGTQQGATKPTAQAATTSASEAQTTAQAGTASSTGQGANASTGSSTAQGASASTGSSTAQAGSSSTGAQANASTAGVQASNQAGASTGSSSASSTGASSAAAPPAIPPLAAPGGREAAVAMYGNLNRQGLIERNPFNKISEAKSDEAVASFIVDGRFQKMRAQPHSGYDPTTSGSMNTYPIATKVLAARIKSGKPLDKEFFEKEIDPIFHIKNAKTYADIGRWNRIVDETLKAEAAAKAPPAQAQSAVTSRSSLAPRSGATTLTEVGRGGVATQARLVDEGLISRPSHFHKITDAKTDDAVASHLVTGRFQKMTSEPGSGYDPTTSGSFNTFPIATQKMAERMRSGRPVDRDFFEREIDPIFHHRNADKYARIAQEAAVNYRAPKPPTVSTLEGRLIAEKLEDSLTRQRLTWNGSFAAVRDAKTDVEIATQFAKGRFQRIVSDKVPGIDSTSRGLEARLPEATEKIHRRLQANKPLDRRFFEEEVDPIFSLRHGARVEAGGLFGKP